jgi:hypothetical protein
MLRLLIVAFVSAAALPASAQASEALKKARVPPEVLLADLGIGSSDEEIARQVAAASAYPLGSRENPVRVGGPQGQQDYIARLRCVDGSEPRTSMREDAGIGAFGSVVQGFHLDCGAAAPGKVRLVMDMYHAEHREEGAPVGFRIVPAP